MSPPRFEAPAVPRRSLLLASASLALAGCAPAPRGATARGVTARSVTPPCSAVPELRRGFVRSLPEAEGLAAAAVHRLRQRAQEEHSGALVVVKNGKLVLEEHFGAEDGPIMAMSATKSFAAVAVLHAVQEESIASLDAPASEYIGVWAKPSSEPERRRARVTVRQMLNHSSGLSLARARFHEGQTMVARAAETTLEDEPGTVDRYNNNAVDLLSLVIEGATGLRLDDYLQRFVFGPMGIVGAHWRKSADGHPLAAGELLLHPVEMAKLGQLVVNGGTWGRETILSPALMKEMLAPSPLAPQHGLLWWLPGHTRHRVTETQLTQWKGAGVPEATLAKLRPLLGTTLGSAGELMQRASLLLAREEMAALLHMQTERRFPPGETEVLGPPKAFMAAGWLGQYIVAVPSARLVAVRMRRWRESDADPVGSLADNHFSFAEDVLTLAAS